MMPNALVLVKTELTMALRIETCSLRSPAC